MGNFELGGCDDKQNKKNFTGSADSTVMVAGNSRGDAAADIFSLRYAAGRTQQIVLLMCTVTLDLTSFMRMHNKIMTRIYINWTHSYAYGTRVKTS